MQIAWILGLRFFIHLVRFSTTALNYFFSLFFSSTRNVLFRSDLFCCNFFNNKKKCTKLQLIYKMSISQCKLKKIKIKLQNKPRLEIENNVMNFGRYRERAGAFGMYFSSLSFSLCYSFSLFSLFSTDFIQLVDLIFSMDSIQIAQCNFFAYICSFVLAVRTRFALSFSSLLIKTSELISHMMARVMDGSDKNSKILRKFRSFNIFSAHYTINRFGIFPNLSREKRTM